MDNVAYFVYTTFVGRKLLEKKGWVIPMGYDARINTA